MRQTKFVLIDTCESCHRECRLLHSRCIRWCCTLVKEICNNRQCKQSLKPRQLQSPQQLLRKSVPHRLAACVQRSQGFVIVASSVLFSSWILIFLSGRSTISLQWHSELQWSGQPQLQWSGQPQRRETRHRMVFAMARLWSRKDRKLEGLCHRLCHESLRVLAKDRKKWPSFLWLPEQCRRLP